MIIKISESKFNEEAIYCKGYAVLCVEKLDDDRLLVAVEELSELLIINLKNRTEIIKISNNFNAKAFNLIQPVIGLP